LEQKLVITGNVAHFVAQNRNCDNVRNHTSSTLQLEYDFHLILSTSNHNVKIYKKKRRKVIILPIHTQKLVIVISTQIKVLIFLARDCNLTKTKHFIHVADTVK